VPHTGGSAVLGGDAQRLTVPRCVFAVEELVDHIETLMVGREDQGSDPTL
jgi:hypothetical protein